MKKLFLLLILLFTVPVFAQNLTVVTSINGTTALINSRQNLTVFNITVVANNAHVNITGLNITINSASSGNVSGNITKIHVLNSSLGGLLLGTNSSINPNLSSGNQIFVNFSTPLSMLNGSRTGLLVVFEMSNVTRGITIGGNLTGAGDIIANHSVVLNASLPNVTLATTRDLRANATISPRFVDTSVVNQTFVYTVVHTGVDNISTLLIQIPSNFTNVIFQNVTYSNSNSSPGVSGAVTGSVINVTITTPVSTRIEVYFTANTSANTVSSILFPSFLYGGNIDNFTTDATSIGAINVTTQPILNLSNVTITKGTAIVNGTDFWEFNITLNYTANISSGGLIQFKLTNWNTTSGNVINITDANCPGSRCATLRNDTNFNATSGKFNVTNDYESFTKGISVSSITQGNLITVILRMVIPTGTVISSGWQATYGFLFRAIP